MTRIEKARHAPKKVLVVDDHPLVLTGLVELINQSNDMIVSGQAGTIMEAMADMRVNRPDLIIMDLSLQGVNGLDLIKEIKALDERMPILVYSMHEEALYAERSIRAGAMGYIMKEQPTAAVLDAARRVLSGSIYLSDAMASRMLSRSVDARKSVEASSSGIESLSDRELEVFQFMGQGKGTREIAEKLHLSVKTIESHREHIKEKLSLENANAVLHYAVRWHLQTSENEKSAKPEG